MLKLHLFYKKISKLFLNCIYKIKIEGKENIPKEQGYLICSNHIHAFDPILINTCTKHQISYMAKKELFKIPILDLFLKSSGAFPVDRGHSDLNSIKKAIEILKNKKVLSIFPEGTRHKDGKFKDIKHGAAFVAIESETKILPVRIIGNYKPFSKITVRIGKPINSIGCNKFELTEKLKIAIENLSPVVA